MCLQALDNFHLVALPIVVGLEIMMVLQVQIVPSWYWWNVLFHHHLYSSNNRYLTFDLYYSSKTLHCFTFHWCYHSNEVTRTVVDSSGGMVVYTNFEGFWVHLELLGSAPDVRVSFRWQWRKGCIDDLGRRMCLQHFLQIHMVCSILLGLRYCLQLRLQLFLVGIVTPRGKSKICIKFNPAFNQFINCHDRSHTSCL